MNNPRIIASALLLLCAPLLAQETAPTIDPNTYLPMPELQKYFDQKQYLLVSQQITKIQANRRELAQYNLYDLLVLKAEAMFRTARYTQGAIDTINQAAKENKDQAKAAECYATGLLFKRASAGFKFQPKSKDAAAPAVPGTPGGSALPAPIDLTDMSQRKAAIAALYNDELVASEAVLKAARTATALGPIAGAARTLSDLRVLELAASNSTLRGEGTAHDLATHAATLMTTAIEKAAVQVSSLERTANTLDSYYETIYDAAGKPAGQQLRQRRRGLSSAEVNQLKAIAVDADRITVATKELTELLKVDGKAFAGVDPAAVKLGASARAVGNADYSGVIGVPRR